MRTGSRFLVVVLVFLALNASGQADYAFKVLANKGANEYKSGDTWQPVKTGLSLNVGDELKVPENAYLGLVSKTGKPLEIKTAKNYKVADLLSQVGSGGTSVMAKYTDFILSSNSAEAKKNRLNATGAVHRGGKGTLNLYMPDAQSAAQLSNIYNNTVYLVWEAPAAGGPYVVTLLDFMEEEMFKVETPETSVKLDLSDPKLAKVSNFLVRVSSKADSQIHSESSIKRLTAAEHDKIKKAYEEIAADVSGETAFAKYLQAGFYDQHGLVIDALACYEQAVRMAPDVETFVEARNEFLYRRQLAVDPQKK